MQACTHLLAVLLLLPSALIQLAWPSSSLSFIRFPVFRVSQHSQRKVTAFGLASFAVFYTSSVSRYYCKEVSQGFKPGAHYFGGLTFSSTQAHWDDLAGALKFSWFCLKLPVRICLPPLVQLEPDCPSWPPAQLRTRKAAQMQITFMVNIWSCKWSYRWSRGHYWAVSSVHFREPSQAAVSDWAVCPIKHLRTQTVCPQPTPNTHLIFTLPMRGGVTKHENKIHVLITCSRLALQGVHLRLVVLSVLLHTIPQGRHLQGTGRQCCFLVD